MNCTEETIYFDDCINTVPVQSADLHGCFCQLDECCGLSKVGPQAFPLQLGMLPTHAEHFCSTLTLKISLKIKQIYDNLFYLNV